MFSSTEYVNGKYLNSLAQNHSSQHSAVEHQGFSNTTYLARIVKKQITQPQRQLRKSYIDDEAGEGVSYLRVN